MSTTFLNERDVFVPNNYLLLRRESITYYTQLRGDDVSKLI